MICTCKKERITASAKSKCVESKDSPGTTSPSSRNLAPVGENSKLKRTQITLLRKNIKLIETAFVTGGKSETK